MIVPRTATLRDCSTPLLLAGEVKAEKVNTVFLVAGRAQGSIQAVFTIWSALAAGIGLGAAIVGLRTLARHKR